MNISDNEYNLISEDNTLYTIRISGYNENTADWKVKNSSITGNVVLGSQKREQIYATGGQIERLNVKGGKLDVKNSPAKIRGVQRDDVP